MATNRNILRPGTRVHAKGKPGIISYVRMAPPSFYQPEAYSVMLDERNGLPGYSGTLFDSNDVLEVTADTALQDAAAAHEQYRANREQGRGRECGS